MKAVVVAPGSVYIQEIDGWDGMKNVLDGAWLESVPVGEDFTLYVDEDGISKELLRNEVATIITKKMLAKMGRSLLPGDFVKGVAVFVGMKDTGGEDGWVECDIPESVVKKYFAKYLKK